MHEKSLILFDGICNMCNGFVNFLIPRDKKNKFMFGSLQTESVKAFLKKFNYNDEKIETVILIEGDKLYKQSTAVLRIAKKMGGGWPLLYGFIIIPRPLRDIIYNLIARNRYRLFGKKDSCMMPTPALKARFIS